MGGIDLMLKRVIDTRELSMGTRWVIFGAKMLVRKKDNHVESFRLIVWVIFDNTSQPAGGDRG
jgi:hypothetical protein